VLTQPKSSRNTTTRAATPEEPASSSSRSFPRTLPETFSDAQRGLKITGANRVCINPIFTHFISFIKPTASKLLSLLRSSSSSTAPLEVYKEGWSRQTSKNDSEKRVFSKTIFADRSSLWLRGQDAGSPGAVPHLSQLSSMSTTTCYSIGISAINWFDSSAPEFWTQDPITPIVKFSNQSSSY